MKAPPFNFQVDKDAYANTVYNSFLFSKNRRYKIRNRLEEIRTLDKQKTCMLYRVWIMLSQTESKKMGQLRKKREGNTNRIGCCGISNYASIQG